MLEAERATHKLLETVVNISARLAAKPNETGCLSVGSEG